MTAQELNALKEQTGLGSTAIYKAAHTVNRVPFAWEVVYLTNPHGRGRKYQSLYSARRTAAYRHLSHMGIWFKLTPNDIEWALHNFVFETIYAIRCDILWEEFNDFIDWRNKYQARAYEELSPDERERCTQDDLDLLLTVVKRLKSIVYGG